MRRVSKWEEIERNLMELERLSGSQHPGDLAAYRDLIAKGICFLVYRRGGHSYFAPSRFIGYVGNTLAKHGQNEYKDGTETTPAISDILGHQPQAHDGLEGEYGAFCRRIAVEPPAKGAFGVQRKYWVRLS